MKSKYDKIPYSPCYDVTKRLVDYVKEKLGLREDNLAFSYNDKSDKNGVKTAGYISFSFLCDPDEKDMVKKIVDGFNEEAKEQTDSFYAIYKEAYMGKDVDEYEVTTGFGYGRKDFYEKDNAQTVDKNEENAMLNNPDATDLYNAESGDYGWRKRHY